MRNTHAAGCCIFGAQWPAMWWTTITALEDTVLIAGLVLGGIVLAFVLRATVSIAERARLRAPLWMLLCAALAWLAIGIGWPKLPPRSALHVVPVLLVFVAYGRLLT